jgi:hypothetical protein
MKMNERLQNERPADKMSKDEMLADKMSKDEMPAD